MNFTIANQFIDRLKTDPNILDVSVTAPTDIMLSEITSYYDLDPSLLMLFIITYKNPDTNKVTDLYIVMHEQSYDNPDIVDPNAYEPVFLTISNVEPINNVYPVFFLDPQARQIIKLTGHSIVASTTVPDSLKTLPSKLLEIQGVTSTRFYDLYGADSDKILLCVVTAGTTEYLNSLSPTEYNRFIYETGESGIVRQISFFLNRETPLSDQEIIDIVNNSLGNTP